MTLAGLALVLTLSAAPRKSADAIRRRAEVDRRSRFEERAAGPSALPLAGALGVAALGLQGWRWIEAGEWLRVASLGAGGLVCAPLLGALGLRFLRRPEALESRVAQQKLAGPLHRARIEVLAIASERTDSARLDALGAQLASAYAAFDDPSGGASGIGIGSRCCRGSSRVMSDTF